MSFSVTDAIDRYVAALEEPREPDGYLHPSGLFRCPRQAVYDFLGTPKSDPPDERTRRVFRIGTILHEFIQAALLQHPDVLAVWNEVKVYDPERNLKGAADSLALLRDGSWLVVELKSINSFGFKYVKESPKPDHRKQAGTYLSILRRYGATVTVDGKDMVLPPLGPDSNLRFAYVDKSTLDIAEFDVFLDDELEAEIDADIAVIEDAISGEYLPDRLPDVVSTNKKTLGQTVRNGLCSYCDWQTTCWSPAEGVNE